LAGLRDAVASAVTGETGRTVWTGGTFVARCASARWSKTTCCPPVDAVEVRFGAIVGEFGGGSAWQDTAREGEQRSRSDVVGVQWVTLRRANCGVRRRACIVDGDGSTVPVNITASS
jgi:hypothetical protein